MRKPCYHQLRLIFWIARDPSKVEFSPVILHFEMDSSVGRASKEDEILIWIRDYKGSGTPWLLLKCLMEGDSCSLITQKQLFDFVRRGNRDGSGQQMFALANICNEHRFEDKPQVESCIVAEDLPIVWRIARDEFDREAELVCIEITRALDVRNEELRLN